ncbi:hypothetical protein QTO34_008504 [Cnephaeus nilssonii]|uniref:Dihydropteridine reductase n=1 Tax=Cnephaeus nilssonii TaxID=3371016 RepID=A0AA40LU53_CNENI|nr:hypothetical protein QTO34_008504 [Eptesicus nilssonii]
MTQGRTAEPEEEERRKSLWTLVGAGVLWKFRVWLSEVRVEEEEDEEFGGGMGWAGVDWLRSNLPLFPSSLQWVASIDVVENEEASASVVVRMTDSFTEQADQVTAEVGKLLGEEKVDAILCVAGGWAGGNAKSKSLFKNCDLMWKQSMWTSTISSHLATKHLKEGGLLTLAGAKAALDGTPGMIGYGMAKGAVHQLCQSLAGKNSGMPPGAAAIAVLPITLDTPMNRKSMPEADFSSWTPLEFLVQTFHDWITEKNRPSSGSLIQVVTTEGKTELTPAYF